MFHDLFRLFTHLPTDLCICVDAYMPQHTRGYQRTACVSQFCPSTMWVLQVKLRLSGWAASTLTCRAISSTSQETDKQKRSPCAGWWWRTPLIPALRRQRQVGFCEFKASLVYRVSCRTGSKATEKPVSKKKKSKTKNDPYG